MEECKIKKTSSAIYIGTIAVLLSIIGYLIFRPEASKFDLLKEVQKVSNELLPGDAPNFLSAAAVRAYGYGSCGEFNSIMIDDLNKYGILSREVSIGTHDGRVHSLLEVNVDGSEWVLTNPMIGIVYNHSLYEIFENPKLAADIQGDPFTDRGAYYGVDFFEDISYVHLGTFEELTSSPADVFQQMVLDDSGKQTEKVDNEIVVRDNAKISLKWTSSLEPKFVYFTASDDVEVKIMGSTNKYSKLMNTDTRGLYLNESIQQAGNVTIEFRNISGKEAKVKYNLLAPNKNIDKIANVFSPVASYISFTGGKADIDRISIECDGLSVFDVNVGDTVSERVPSQFLYANEYFAFETPTNTWGPILQDEDRNFRTAGLLMEESINKQAALLVRPALKRILNANACTLIVEYRHADQEEAYVNLFNPQKQTYETVGALPSSNDWRTVEFPLNMEVLRSLEGESKFFE